MKKATITFLLICISSLLLGDNVCLDLDGTDDHIVIIDDNALDFGTSTDFSIEAWINFSSSDNYDGIVCKATSEDSENWTGYQFLLYENKIALELNNGNEDNLLGPPTGQGGFLGSTAMNTGTWHHVAITVSRSTNTVKFYVDGVEDASVSDSKVGSNDLDNSANLYIGKERTSDYYYNGHIDEVRIWNDVRSVSEIRQNMYRELSNPSSEGNLAAYYKLDQDANDSKGTNNGTWNGSGGGSYTSAAWKTSGSMFGPKNCLDFDGSDDYVDLTNSSDLKPTTALTFECWINADNWNPSSNQNFAGNTQSGGYNFSIGFPDSTDVAFSVHSFGNYRRADADITGFTGWHHVAGTFDGRYVLLYVDGILSGQYDMGSTVNTIYYSVPNSTILGEEAGQ